MEYAAKIFNTRKLTARGLLFCKITPCSKAYVRNTTRNEYMDLDFGLILSLEFYYVHLRILAYEPFMNIK